MSKGQSTGCWHVQRGLKYIPALKTGIILWWIMTHSEIFCLDTF